MKNIKEDRTISTKFLWQEQACFQKSRQARVAGIQRSLNEKNSGTQGLDLHCSMQKPPAIHGYLNFN